jgi:hypothetical protein
VATILDAPLDIFVLTVVGLWIASLVGTFVAARLRPVRESEWDDLNLVTTASLTLLALIIGFSFSMALGRYDQRRNYEEEEANAIGTEYVRADLLPADDAAKVRSLLRQFLNQRLLFYTIYNAQQLNSVATETVRLENEMWSTVETDVVANPTPPMALVLSGMNDVLNRQGYSQAAWWYRIPRGAWSMMGVLSMCNCFLVGYGAHRRGFLMIPIIPVLVAIAFFYIADIDSPRRGNIRIIPRNLISLSQSLHSQ